MKMPLVPPSFDELVAGLDDARLPKVLSEGKPVVDGKYLHWDEVRHRQPPSDLTHREWWAALKFARTSAREDMPLLDKEGRFFNLVYVSPIRHGLHQIDQSFGMVGPGRTPSEAVTDIVGAHGGKYLLGSSMVEEAIRSSQLEGASTTRARAKEMIRRREKPRDRSERMILNNFHAMELIEDLSDQPLTEEIVFRLHRILVDDTLDEPDGAGRYRTVDDDVVVELLHTVETAHVPPLATELPDRMARLLRFGNDETPEEWLHPLLRAVILHFMIGYDHPFVDGNGRVARALFYWAMLRHGYAFAKFLSISKILREAPARYSRAYLFTETDGSDLTYFVDHQLGVILQSIDALSSYVDEKVAATRDVEAKLHASADLNHRQLRLLGHALRHPGFTYTVKSHMRSHRVATNTARTDLVDLAERGLLAQSRQGREHVFLAPSDLDARASAMGPG